MVTRRARDLNGGIRPVGEIREMLAIDGLDHAQHLSGLGFRRLLIRGEIKLRQGHAPLAHVTMLATHTQARGKPTHGIDEFARADVLREHLEIHQRVRRKLRGCRSQRAERHQRGEQENLVMSRDGRWIAYEAKDLL